MSIRKVTPYLNFDGTAEKAIKLYESALGAKTENLSRFGDVPGANVDPALKNRVVHALLRIGEGTIMISDSQPGVPVQKEGNIHVSLDFDNVDETAKKFTALAAGGQITMPLADTFWGAKFGMLTDAYGVRWMFNCEVKK